MGSLVRRLFCCGLKCNRKGVTLAEICIALMILGLGMVSILALFPKAIKTTRDVMDITTSSLVARSAMATLLYEVDRNFDPYRQPVWVPNTITDWPETVSSARKYTGSITVIDTADVTVTNIKDGWVASGGGADDITRYFLMITSGVGKGMLYKITDVTLDTGGSDPDYNPDLVTIDANAIDNDVEVGDSFRIIGPNCSGLRKMIVHDEGGVMERTLYSWLAVVCGPTGGVNGVYKTYIFVYGRDFLAMNDSDLNDIRRIDSLYKSEPIYNFTTYLAKKGT